MIILRLVLYMVAILESAILAGQFLRIGHPLARLLALTMVAWGINAATLFVMLWLVRESMMVPEWRNLLMTGNAVLLVSVPAVLYVWFSRVNGNNG